MGPRQIQKVSLGVDFTWAKCLNCFKSCQNTAFSQWRMKANKFRHLKHISQNSFIFPWGSTVLFKKLHIQVQMGRTDEEMFFHDMCPFFLGREWDSLKNRCWVGPKQTTRSTSHRLGICIRQQLIRIILFSVIFGGIAHVFKLGSVDSKPNPAFSGFRFAGFGIGEVKMSPSTKSKKNLTKQSQRIHGTGIFTYIYHKNQPFM